MDKNTTELKIACNCTYGMNRGWNFTDWFCWLIILTKLNHLNRLNQEQTIKIGSGFVLDAAIFIP